ncbi:MAG: 1-deoxy-D-xylulose-5-phosphate synthase [Cyanobacteria bacterium SZAS LIN-3]|nr:1-deoxy-D-xylulose-5-phosphate synthase [Cyanobacteria bacterium SZAS LIN-3]
MHTLAKPTTTFLEAVITPTELKKLSIEELNSLGQEIRQEIVCSLAKTGGHLASNLGVVEITIALHKVFNSPNDQILWDVGHQAYVHKMLTGRRDKFNTLRQFKGLSGFISPFESEHDSFIAGHSSTSISLAVGMVLARDHLKQDRKVIAVIGDGGLTGGMALEAINHLGHIQKDVIIILNDNEMSISENVGGFSQYMKRIRETFFYKDIKRKIDFIEDKLDQANLNPAVKDLIQIVKKEAKDRFDTPGIVFEKLGVNYSGPIDGHDLSAVIKALNAVKNKSTPQIIHIITRKGKGYAPAEADSIKYHGVPAFALEPALTEKAEPSVVSVAPKPKTYSDVFTEALIDIAKIEPNMVAITPATAEGSGLVKFGKVYPDRFFDVAICEQHAVTMAAGMAKLGVKPVVSIYSTFLQRAMDQIIHDVAIMNLPVVFGIDRGGLVEDGETHQGVFDISFLRAVPNFTVLAPKDARELRNMLYTAIKESKGPVAIRFPREKAVNSQALKGPEDFELIDLTKWQVLTPGLPGHGVLLAYGGMVETVIQVLPALSDQGLEPMVVAARSAKPLDEALLRGLLLDGGNKIVTLEEGQLSGGFGAAVLEYLSSLKVANPAGKYADIVNLGIPDRFVEHGARPILLDEVGLSPARVTQFLLSYLKA